MEKNNMNFGFQAQNYKLLLIGLAINVLGFILMIGGATEDPNQFDGEELFSARRITFAPILIVAGYVVIIYAIMKKPGRFVAMNSKNQDTVEGKASQTIEK